MKSSARSVWSLFGGVVALAEEHGLEGVVGGEVGAGLADRLEAAVELGGSLTPAVAEEAVVDFVFAVGACSGPSASASSGGPVV